MFFVDSCCLPSLQSWLAPAAQALEEYGQWAASIMSGVGLQERGEVVKTTGLTCGMTADHLDDMAVNDENMVSMLENPECSIDQASAIRVLSESTARTATVVRCAADKAICIANSVLELGCSLAMLDQERRREKAQKTDVVESAVGESNRSSQSNLHKSESSETGLGLFSPKAGHRGARADGANEGDDREDGEDREESEEDHEDGEEEEEAGSKDGQDGKPKQAPH